MLFENLPTQEAPKRETIKVTKTEERQPLFNEVRVVHNSVLEHKAIEKHSERIDKSLLEYKAEVDPQKWESLAVSVLTRAYNDAICNDMLICNDFDLSETEGVQIRALRYIIRKDSDFCWWCIQAGIDYDWLWQQYMNDFISRGLVKKLKNLETDNFDKYHIIHKALLKGIWDDDEARQKAGLKTEKNDINDENDLDMDLKV